MSVDKMFYNEASAAKLGWDPSWFCAEDFDELLVNNIKAFQRDHELLPDGLCGPLTYRRARTAREASFEDDIKATSENNIVANGELIPIDWDKVVSLVDDGNLALPPNCYKTVKSRERVPTMVVTHWDVCLSALSCYKVLKKKGISSHCVIDNDGTIYQMVDPQHIGWHAGNRKVNTASIGIDFSNAYYDKYQKYYRKRGFGNRPLLVDSVVHGRKLKPHLGYYPVQIKAYKALIKCLENHYSFGLECPLDEDGNLLTKVSDAAAKAKFEGVVCHYHLTNRKIDCAGLELDKILTEVENEH